MTNSTNLIERLRWLTRSGLDLIFPPQCVGCGVSGYTLCPDCSQAVQPIPKPRCNRCGRPQIMPMAQCDRCRQEASHTLRMVRAAAQHTDPLRPAIHSLKYEERTDLAASLARYLVAAFSEAEWRELAATIDGVTPVPLHPERLAERGYNQSELLAEAFCRRTGLALRSGWIHRRRDTQPQVGLNAQERHSNVLGAFEAENEVCGKCVLLIDDVFTTGATLTACADAMAAAGASATYALTLAMPVYDPA